MRNYRIGYSQGVFDMFHIGHLNLLKAAKQRCDYLVVGVNADSLVQKYKHKTPVIKEEERRIIVNSIKEVDEAIITTTHNKIEILELVKFEVYLIGDDWKGHPRLEQTEIDLKRYGVDVVYLPYTPNISSTGLRLVKDRKVEG